MRDLSSRRRRRTAAAATMAAALGLTSLAGCGSDGAARAGGGDSLHIWVYQDGSTTIQQEIVEKFNETSDIKAELVEVPGKSYQDKLRTSMGSANAPDIFFNWGGGSISEFVNRDLLMDLTPVLEENPELKKAFIPTILDQGAIEDRNYGIPMRGVQPVVLFYNKELFRKADVRPPETWQDMLKAMDTFRDEGITPAVLAGQTPWTGLMWMEYLVDRIGGADIVRRASEGESDAWGDPAVLEAAETVEQLVDDGAFGDNYKSVQYENDAASTLFAQGKAAMHLMGSWEYANQKAAQPDFAKNKLGYTTFPAFPDGEGDPSAVVGNPTNYWSVHSKVKGEKREAAVEFLKLMASEEYSRLLIENGDVPTTVRASSMLKDHEDPAYAKFIYNLMENASDFTLSWDQILPSKESTAMIGHIEKLFNGQITPKQFTGAMRRL